jgi:hypothetical protein
VRRGSGAEPPQCCRPIGYWNRAAWAVPVTGPARTLVDITTELGPIGVERAVNDADKRDLIDPETLRVALGQYAGEPGVRPLRLLLDKLTFRLSDSDLEIFFRPIATAAGLSSPLSKHFVNSFEVDFYWPELGLVVETDGLRYHRTPSSRLVIDIRYSGWSTSWKRATWGGRGQADRGRKEPE